MALLPMRLPLHGACTVLGDQPHDPKIDAVARSIGADVPFFLYGPPAHLVGFGDEMHELFRPLTGTPVALVKPLASGVSACDAYAQFDREPVPVAPLEPMLDALRAHDENAIFAHVANNLAPAACTLEPEIARIAAWMREQPEVRAVEVTGSGACVFAVCNTQMAADAIVLDAINEHGWWGQSAKMEKTGPFVAVG